MDSEEIEEEQEMEEGRIGCEDGEWAGGTMIKKSTNLPASSVDVISNLLFSINKLYIHKYTGPIISPIILHLILIKF